MSTAEPGTQGTIPLGTLGTPGTIGTGVFGAISSAEQYFLMGSLLDDGTPERVEEAVKSYRRALEEDPDLVAALINLANIRYSRDELAEAQALYERAISLDDSYFEAHFNLGNIHHDHGRYAEAEASYRDRAGAQSQLCRRALLSRGDARENGPLDRRARPLEGLRAPRAERRVGRARPRILGLTSAGHRRRITAAIGSPPAFVTTRIVSQPSGVGPAALRQQGNPARRRRIQLGQIREISCAAPQRKPVVLEGVKAPFGAGVIETGRHVHRLQRRGL